MSDSDYDSDASDEKEEKSLDCSDSAVLTKYMTASEICMDILKLTLESCQVGAAVVDICEASDKLITERCSKVYKKQAIEKGVAFPTCISVNEVAGHYSPLGSDTVTLQEGDLVKIDLGVQIDGFAAVVAQTKVLSNDDVTGRQADVIKAAWTGAEAAIRLVKPGGFNSQVTEAFAKAAASYNCSVLDGVLSHEMKQMVLDGRNCIIGKESADKKVEEFEFEPNKVYAIDVVMCTNEDGKCIDRGTETCTVFKRVVDNTYRVKMKSARRVLGHINKVHPAFPFCLRSLMGEFGVKAKMGLKELLDHDLIQSYPVLTAKQGEYIAQFKFTAICLPKGTIKATGLAPDLSNVNSEFEVEDSDLAALLKTSYGNKRKKRRKKKKKKNNQTVARQPQA